MKKICSPGYHHNSFVATHAHNDVRLHIAGTSEY